MPGKIYLVSLNGVPKYVGFTTKTVEQRWKEHIRSSNSKKGGFVLHDAIRKYGLEAFTITEIYFSDDVNHTLNVIEPQFIREYNTHVDCGGYNISYGGEASTRGRKHSEETKEKLRQRFFGKPLSEEHRKKLRQSHLGKVLPEKQKEKIRQKLLGRVFSEEHKEKIRQSKSGKSRPSLLGKPLSEEHKEKIRQARIRNHNQSKSETFRIISAT